MHDRHPVAAPPHACAELIVDLAAVRDNYRLLRREAGRATCAAVLKANAYGLGAARIAPVLVAEGCRHFFVAQVEEGVALRPHLPADATVYVLHGVQRASITSFLRYDLTPVLNSIGQVSLWRDLSLSGGKRLPAVLQFDTGMSRMGLSPDEVALLQQNRQLLDCLDIRMVMSHLACAEQQGHAMNARQLARFHACRSLFPGVPASLANSSGIFLGETYQFDLVRPGAALYGIAPVQGQPNPLRQVVTIRAPVIQVRTIGEGDAVGYGARYCADGERIIATLGIGYADGWPRLASGRTLAFRGDAAAPQVGSVSMDSMSVDITGLDSPAITSADAMEVVCARQTVDEVAAAASTIGYEFLTRLGNRFQRVYLDEKGVAA